MLERGLDESACVVPVDTPPLSLSPDCNQEFGEGSLESVAVIYNSSTKCYWLLDNTAREYLRVAIMIFTSHFLRMKN